MKQESFGRSDGWKDGVSMDANETEKSDDHFTYKGPLLRSCGARGAPLSCVKAHDLDAG